MRNLRRRTKPGAELLRREHLTATQKLQPDADHTACEAYASAAPLNRIPLSLPSKILAQLFISTKRMASGSALPCPRLQHRVARKAQIAPKRDIWRDPLDLAGLRQQDHAARLPETIGICVVVERKCTAAIAAHCGALRSAGHAGALRIHVRILLPKRNQRPRRRSGDFSAAAEWTRTRVDGRLLALGC